MLRLLICSLCLLMAAQAAHAGDDPGSFFHDGPANGPANEPVWSPAKGLGDRDPEDADHGAPGYDPRAPEPAYPSRPRPFVPDIPSPGVPNAYDERHEDTRHRSGDGLAALGERLFFDKSLSGSGHTACATCHDPRHGFAEPRPVSLFDTGKQGPRNAPTIIDIDRTPTIMWDGRIRTIEEQALFPLSRNGEMGIDAEDVVERLRDDPGYSRQFEAALGEPPSKRGIGRAIGAFERTIVSGSSPFDRFWRSGDQGDLSPMARHGFEIFTGKGGCADCHELPRDRHEKPVLSDFRFHNVGVGFERGEFKDIGRAKVTQNDRDVGAFRTPSLRNVELTAPYMHDGSERTLEDVVEFYDDGGRQNPNLDRDIRPLHLSQHEKEALVAFLRSLTDPEYARDREGRFSRR